MFFSLKYQFGRAKQKHVAGHMLTAQAQFSLRDLDIRRLRIESLDTRGSDDILRMRRVNCICAFWAFSKAIFHFTQSICFSLIIRAQLFKTNDIVS